MNASRELIFTAGEWTVPAGTDVIDVVNPATEVVIGTVPAGTPGDIGTAVGAAREAFTSWSATSPAERAAHLAAIRDGLAARAEEAALLVTAELGAPLTLSQK